MNHWFIFSPLSKVFIKDEKWEIESMAIITAIDGIEIRLEGSDSDAIFGRAKLIIEATDHAVSQFSRTGGRRLTTIKTALTLDRNHLQ